MPQLKLFVAPNTCALVPTIALEEIGIPFETELLRTMANQQNSAEFLKINPKGKVPTLLIDDVPLTENVAILTWLNETFPKASLLPSTDDRFEQLKQMADLAFFAGTVHPTVTRISMPVKFIEDKDLSFKLVRPVGIKAMTPIMNMIEDRLSNGPWWYGERWSVVDGYLFWVWRRVRSGGFPDEAYPNIQKHHEISHERTAVQRATAREVGYFETLKEEGLIAAKP